MYKTLAARGGLPWTPVGFSRGALLRGRVSALPIHPGKTVEIGIINDVTGNALLASILLMPKTLRKLSSSIGVTNPYEKPKKSPMRS